MQKIDRFVANSENVRGNRVKKHMVNLQNKILFFYSTGIATRGWINSKYLLF